MKKCGDCYLFKKGCEFSENDQDGTMKDFVACLDYVDEEGFNRQIDKAIID